MVDEEGDALDLGEESPPPQPTEIKDHLERSQLRINLDEDEEPFMEEEILDTDQ